MKEAGANERDSSDSYQKYVRDSIRSSQGADVLRRSRERASAKQIPEVIRETSWDSDKESPKTKEENHGTQHSGRSSGGSAYDKYNLADDGGKKDTKLLKK